MINSKNNPLKKNSSRDKNTDDGSYLHPSSPCDQDSAPSLKAFLLKAPRDKKNPEPLIIQSLEGDVPQDNSPVNDSIKIISSDSNLLSSPDFNQNTGNIASILSKDSNQIISNISSASETLPSHLKHNPPTLVILEGINGSSFTVNGHKSQELIQINFVLKIFLPRRFH